MDTESPEYREGYLQGYTDGARVARLGYAQATLLAQAALAQPRRPSSNGCPGVEPPEAVTTDRLPMVYGLGRSEA